MYHSNASQRQMMFLDALQRQLGIVNALATAVISP